MGPLLPLSVSRLALALRIQALVKGCSGVTMELIEHLVALYNRGVVPAMGRLDVDDRAVEADANLVRAPVELYALGKARAQLGRVGVAEP